ncbi:adenylate/guanylate cyclase domain-containing protein [Afifella pfennigii]|uniref:adenylate/guanylate cyclase domain-containing protein n=1 Tax=Afifella pfennigii TaxID=209897 RepID=UPI00068D688E|nr:adenylate/guanylate cyclase domain-containing protein [Afifella pfennigii]
MNQGGLRESPLAAGQASGISQRLARSLIGEERAGRRLAIHGRSIAFLCILLLLFFLIPVPAVFYYQTILAVFIILGFVRLWLDAGQLYRWWTGYLLTAVDFALLAYVLLYPNPFWPAEHPPQYALRTGSFVYFYVMLAGLAFSFQPKEVLWGGLMGALFWALGVVYLVSLPDTVLAPSRLGVVETMQLASQEPTLIDIDRAIQDVGVFLIVSLVLTMVVDRSRSLVTRQANLERERANLARHFPPATVDRLASEDAALSQIREQNGVVLFADLVGFTTWSEERQPAEVIAYLRNVHARLEAAVFRHHGTLDKFIGDGMMATFGTPEPGERDAIDALACVVEILSKFSAWNDRRAQRGARPVRISLGLHYGKVVVGNIGTERRLEFAVLGDTVNVASRLEGLTRQLSCRAVISRALADAARAEAPDKAEELLAGFEDHGAVQLHGRSEPVEILIAK